MKCFYFRTYVTVRSQLIPKKCVLIILQVHVTMQTTVHKWPQLPSDVTIVNRIEILPN